MPLGKVSVRFTDAASNPLARKRVIAHIRNSSLPARIYTQSGTLMSVVGEAGTDDDGVCEFWADDTKLLRLSVFEPASNLELAVLASALPGAFSDTVTPEQLNALISVGPTPPLNPKLNQLWVDTS